MAENTIDLDKLFSGGESFDKIIERIDGIASAAESLQSTMTKTAERYKDALEMMRNSTEAIEKSIESLDVTKKEDQQELIKQSKVIEDAAKDNVEYSKSLKAVENEILVLVQAQEKLRESKKKLEDQTKAEEGSLDDLKKKLSDATKEYNKLGDATDESIKKETLDRIKQLAKNVNEAERAIKDAKKGTEDAAGSYNEFSKKVAKAKVDLKAMGDGMKTNSKEFRELQKFVKDGTEQLKEWDKAIGDNTRNVGNYEDALNGLDNRFGGLITRVKTLGKDLLAIFSNPVILAIAAIIAAFAALGSAVKTFYETTGEGEDILDRQKTVFGGFFSFLKNGWSQAGKAVNNFIDVDLAKLATKGLKYVTIFMTGSIENGKKVEEAFGKIFNKIQEQAVSAFETSDDVGSRTINNIVTSAETQSKLADLLIKANDKLNYSDEERLAYRKEYAKVQEAQSKIDVQLAEDALLATQKQIALDKSMTLERLQSLTAAQKEIELTDAQRQLLAEATAKVINTESEYVLSTKKNAAAIINLTLEIEKAKRDAINREIDSENKLLIQTLEFRKKANEEIIKDEKSSLKERNDATRQNFDLSMQELAAQKAQELAVVKRAAEERARASVPTDQVGNAVANDKSLATEIDVIIKKYEQLMSESDEAFLKSISNNVFKVLAKDAAIAAAEIDEFTSRELIELNNRLDNGLETLKSYEAKKLKIQENGQRRLIESQIKHLKDQLKNVDDNTQGKAELLAKIAKLEVQLSQQTTDHVIADEEKKKQQREDTYRAINEIQIQAFDLANTIVQNQSQRNQELLQKEADDAKNKADEQLRLVGDDAQAKALIQENLAQKQKEIREKDLAERRKAAIFDRGINVVGAIANTARGVTAALPNIPLSILVGALGAIQIAKILATQIPAYWTGIESSPKGPALVGDRGREIVFDRKTNKAKMYDTPTVTFLNEGTKVYDNADTERIMRGYSEFDSIKSRNDSTVLYMQNGMNMALLEALRTGNHEIVRAIMNQPHDFYDERGFRSYERSENQRVLSLNKRYKM